VSEFEDFESILREPFASECTGVAPIPLPPSSPSALPPSRGVALVNGINYTHKDIIDFLLSRPGISQNSVAAHFGYSASYLSQLMVSDAFQAEFAKRREALVDPVIAANVKLNFEALVLRSQEILMEKLSLPAHQVPDQLALRALDLASRAAGYGAKDSTPSITVNVETRLEALGENLERLLDRKRPALDQSIDLGEEN
jgi:hypothetical protein